MDAMFVSLGPQRILACRPFLDRDYGRKKQQKSGAQDSFYLGDGWIGEAFAQRCLGSTVPD